MELGLATHYKLISYEKSYLKKVFSPNLLEATPISYQHNETTYAQIVACTYNDMKISREEVKACKLSFYAGVKE